MHPIAKPFRFLFTVWAAVVFVALLLITAPFFFFVFDPAGKAFIGPLLFLCRFIAGSEHPAGHSFQVSPESER